MDDYNERERQLERERLNHRIGIFQDRIETLRGQAQQHGGIDKAPDAVRDGIKEAATGIFKIAKYLRGNG